MAYPPYIAPAGRASIERDIARIEADIANAREALTDARMALARDNARRDGIAKAGDAYARTRDGDGNGNATPEAREVLYAVQAAHLRGEGVTLTPRATSVLWADIVRRSAIAVGLD